MKQAIKIYFADFWPGLDFQNNFITNALSTRYEVIIDPDPDYLFHSSFGNKHFKYTNCIKIYYTGENDVPDFNLSDYAIGFHYIDFEDRYFRLPLFVLYQGYENITSKWVDKEAALNRKFCNFVYSNNKAASPMRETFFHQLSKYKKVDAGGRFLNNIGSPVSDKRAFIRDYKFTIAFENSCVSGYTTEKILDPMLVDSIPIYWGNPQVGMDFNKESFICVNDYESIDQAIEEVIRLDKDDDAYIRKLSFPWMTPENVNHVKMSQLNDFLEHIIEQPIENAVRTTPYGFSKRYWEKQSLISKVNNNIVRRFLKF